MKNDEVYKLLNLTVSFGINFMLSEQIQRYLVGLIFEIDDLFYEGWTKEEIKTAINESDFGKKLSDLSNEEILVLKNEAIKILDIRYQLYLNNVDEKDKKVKKYLFNK